MRNTSTSWRHFFAVNDLYGNVAQLVRADTRAVVARWDYDAYGKTTKAQAALSTADSLDRAQVNQPYRYQGHYLHAQSGLYDFGFRFYSPTLQRWMSSDPIEESGGINLHSYVGGNPTNSFDPFGLDEMLDYYEEQEAEKQQEEIRREQNRQNNVGDTMPFWAKSGGARTSTRPLKQKVARQALTRTLSLVLKKKAGFGGKGECVIVDSNVNFGGNFAQVLRSRGINARSVKEIFGRDPGDAIISSLAKNLNGRVITADRGTKGGGFGSRAINIPGQVRTAQGALRILKNKKLLK